jgi:hypothetical protein
MVHELMRAVEVRQAITVSAGVVAATNITGTAIDTRGYDCCSFIASFGAITAGAATSISVLQSDDNGVLDDFTVIANSATTILDTDDNTAAFISIFKPQKRWLRLDCARATQNSEVSAVALLSRAGTEAVVHGASVKASSATASANGQKFMRTPTE